VFTVVIAFVCFYHAERILSAIAKSLVYSFAKGKGGLKSERGEVGEDSGEGRRSGKWECTKQIAPECNRYGWNMAEFVETFDQLHALCFII